jgi:hypothetical protein
LHGDGAHNFQNVNVDCNQFYNLTYGISFQGGVGGVATVLGNTFGSPVTYPLNFDHVERVTALANVGPSGQPIYPPASASVGYNSTGAGMHFPMSFGGCTNLTSATSFVALFDENMVDTNYAVVLTGINASMTNYYVTPRNVNGFTANFPLPVTMQLQWMAIHQ